MAVTVTDPERNTIAPPPLGYPAGSVVIEFGKWPMHGEYKMPGGKLVVVDLDLLDGRLANVQLSGDFFLEPDSALHTINVTLTGQSADADEATLATTLHHALSSDVMMYGVSPEAIAVAVCRALHRDPAA